MKEEDWCENNDASISVTIAALGIHTALTQS